MPASGLPGPVADVVEMGMALDWVDPLVATLERVRRPFGCKLLAILLDSKETPEEYEKLLRENGVGVLGIQLLEGFSVGDFIANGCACITIKKKHYNKAMRLLVQHGAIFAY